MIAVFKDLFESILYEHLVYSESSHVSSLLSIFAGDIQAK